MDIAEISFEADGERHALTPPSAGIAFALSRRFGGLDKLTIGVRLVELDTIAGILRLAWPGAPKIESALEQFTFAHLDDVYLPVLRYTLSLQNGGRPIALPGDAPADSDGGTAGNTEGGPSGAPGEPPARRPGDG